MANAIKQISVQRGHDVTEYTLCCVGGAAGQHACLVADALGMTQVFIHPLAGALSAYGMGLADITAMRAPRHSPTLGLDTRHRMGEGTSSPSYGCAVATRDHVPWGPPPPSVSGGSAASAHGRPGPG